MMNDTVLGLDQGTTSTRVLALREQEAPQILHAVRHRQFYPQPGHVEHDAEELLANIRACLDAAGPAKAIGMANQGESCLAWDAVTGKALSPVIVWQDNRTEDWAKQLREDGAEALTLSRAGLPLDPYFSGSKLGWILRNNEAAQSAHKSGTLRLGTTDAFFLDRLAGTFATDTTTASRTSLMNLQTGNWDPDLCALFGVPVECLPEIRPSQGFFGEIDGTPVTASLVDQQAALYGHGCRKAGDTKITFGTGAFALAVTGDVIVSSAGNGLLPTVAWSRGEAATYAVDGGVYDAGAAVEWATSLGIVQSIGELDRFDAPSAISRGIAFVPALSGLACPYWDRSAAGLWIGMTASTTRLDLCQALLEGIALRTAEVIDAIGEHTAIADPISIDGGLTRSSYFCQFLADILGREIIRPAMDELTALGCATLASEHFKKSATTLVAEDATRFRPSTIPRDVLRAKHKDAVGRARGWR
jgi:glycerol kinase